MSELRIGVTRGETTTDAVALDANHRLLATARVESTDAVRDDISRAIRAIVADDAVDPAAVRWVMVGTGHVLEDVAALQSVRRVAVVRIGGPLTTSVPPLATWPPALRAAVSAGEIVVAGGAEYDGRATVALDEDAIARFLAGIGNRAEAVAISGVFAPVSPAHERRAARILAARGGSSDGSVALAFLERHGRRATGHPTKLPAGPANRAWAVPVDRAPVARPFACHADVKAQPPDAARSRGTQILGYGWRGGDHASCAAAPRHGSPRIRRDARRHHAGGRRRRCHERGA
jgi:hypothetical protein